jgi:photosystem II stability/assembly factor-like uncharacterized protein
MLKKLIAPTISLFVLFTSVSYTQNEWHDQNSGTNVFLTDVQFVDQNTGWITGWTGTILHTTDGGTNWNPQNPPPNNAYESVFFVDDQTGWACGSSGKLIHTTDGGNTWTDQVSGTSFFLWDIQFIDSNNGWVAGGDPGSFPNFEPVRLILHTTNGGATWTTQLIQNNESMLLSIDIIDMNNGCAVGETGAILHTTNGGTNWVEQMSTTSYHFYDVSFANSSFGWVVGQFLGIPHVSVIFNTTDAGATWNSQTFEQDEALAGICFTDANNGWAVGGANTLGRVKHTTDGGITWENQTSGTNNLLTKVCFVDNITGWAVGSNGTIIATDDPVPVELTSFTAAANENNVTLSWQTATETNNYGFEVERKISNVGSYQTEWNRIGFVEGNGTTAEEQNYSFVHKFLEHGMYEYRLKQIDLDGSFNYSNIIQVEILTPANFSLDQNYPNPFNPATIIKYSIPSDGFVHLVIFNAIGEELRTLVSEYRTAGKHEVIFDAGNLSSGIYFYRIDAGEFSAIRKMILLQ